MKPKQLVEIGLGYQKHSQEMFCSPAPPWQHQHFLMFSQNTISDSLSLTIFKRLLMSTSLLMNTPPRFCGQIIQLFKGYESQPVI